MNELINLKRFIILLIIILTASSCDFLSNLFKKQQKIVWQRSAGYVNYNLVQKTFDENGNPETPVYEDIRLEFGNNIGDVQLFYDSLVSSAAFTEYGRLVPKDKMAPDFFWELMFLSVLPPDGKVAINKTWTVKRPSDDELNQSNALAGQSEVTYKIESLSPLIISYTGNMRFAPTKGLDKLADDHGVPIVLMRQIATKYKPFLEGKAFFSDSLGYLTRAEGTVRPFAPFGNGDPVNTHPARINYTITKTN